VDTLLAANGVGPLFSTSEAGDINDRGDVIINGKTAGTNPTWKIYYRRANGWLGTPLNPPKIPLLKQVTAPSGFGINAMRGWAINNAGEMALSGYTTSTRNSPTILGLRWTFGSSTASLIPRVYTGGNPVSEAMDINEAGIVVGRAHVASGAYIRAYKHARNAASVDFLPELFESSPSSAVAINNAGYIVGSSHNLSQKERGTYWSPTGSPTEIPKHLAQTDTWFATAITNEGPNGEGRVLLYGRDDLGLNDYKPHSWDPLTGSTILTNGTLGIQGYVRRVGEDSFFTVASRRIASLNNENAPGYTEVFTATAFANPDEILAFGGYNKHKQIVLALRPSTSPLSTKGRTYIGSPIWEDQKDISLDLDLDLGYVAPVALQVKFEKRYGDYTVETETKTVTFTNGQALGVILKTRMRGELDIRASILSGSVLGSNAPVSPHWLSQTTTVARTDGSQLCFGEILFKNGDIDGDANVETSTTNIITTDDYGILSAAFDTNLGGPGWDHRADLNGDGTVSTDDFIILNNNFDTEGTY